MEAIPMSCGYGSSRKRTRTLPGKVLIASVWMSENMRTLQEVLSCQKETVAESWSSSGIGQGKRGRNQVEFIHIPKLTNYEFQFVYHVQSSNA
jgi:hypothetical protein